MNTKSSRAFLGTGLLGSGFVSALRARDVDVVVWNRTASKTVPLVALGARAADTPAAAVHESPIVHLCLADDASVDAVLDAMVPALAKDAWVVDHTTTSPAGARARCERARRDGFRYAHAPVFMSPAMAKASKGIMLLSCSAADEAELRPILAPMTGTLLHVGARDDLAAAQKLFGNAIIIALAGGLADVLTMAKSLGMEPAQAMAIFDTFDAGAGIKVRGARMAKADFEASFELAMARKDVRLMIEAAGHEPLAILPGLASRMDALIGRGMGQRDLGALAHDAVAKEDDGDEHRARVMERFDNCHRRIETVLAEIEMEMDRATGSVDEIIDRARSFAERTIARHEDDEEQSLFPRASRIAEARDVVEQLRRDHREQHAMWSQLADATDRASAIALVRALASSYARHLRHEEEALVPLLGGLTPEEWQSVDDEMRARRGPRHR